MATTIVLSSANSLQVVPSSSAGYVNLGQGSIIDGFNAIAFVVIGFVTGTDIIGVIAGITENSCLTVMAQTTVSWKNSAPDPSRAWIRNKINVEPLCSRSDEQKDHI